VTCRAEVLTHTLCVGAPALSLCYLPSFQPHPPPGLNSSSLHRRVRRLQPELEGVVVGVSQPGVRLSLEGGEMARYVCEVSGDFLCDVCVVAWLAMP
jgi:hypothetical protein